jgi:hypothetical protein
MPKKKIPSYKPALEATMTVRFSAEWKRRIRDTAARYRIAEAEILRYLLEAGLTTLEREGIGALMTRRDELYYADALDRAPKPRGK